MKQKEKFKFVSLVNSCRSKRQVILGMGWKTTSTGYKKLKDSARKIGINISHFEDSIVKYVNKTCPICSLEFKTPIHHPKEKVTCSTSCANKFFRKSCRKHPKDIKVAYKSVCFRYYKKECILCGWNKHVDVHHLDGDRNNNVPENLVPLCPNHHTLLHYSNKYKEQTEKQIEIELKSRGGLEILPEYKPIYKEDIVDDCYENVYHQIKYKE